MSFRGLANGGPSPRKPSETSCSVTARRSRDSPDGVMERLLQQFAGRQFRQVLGDPDAALVELKQLDVLGDLSSHRIKPSGVMLLRS